MPAIKGRTDFDPYKEIPSLKGKVIFITGGNSGIGAETVRLLAAHGPAHIYISGRNAKTAATVINEVSKNYPDVGLTFVTMDMTSLAAIRSAIKTTFVHDRLDILINNAGIMAQPESLSADGYEIQFATNHLGHAMLIRELLPTLLKTAALPSADVRVISLGSLAYMLHPRVGIHFDALASGSTIPGWFMGPWIRYAQTKLANILYASALARKHPSITSVSIHPGVVRTPLVSTQTWYNRLLIWVSQVLEGGLMEPEQGAWNTVWAATVAEKGELRKGGFYMPVGSDGWEKTLDKTARSEELAARLWDWTEEVLGKVA